MRSVEIELPVSVTGWCYQTELPTLLRFLAEYATREVLTDVHKHVTNGSTGLYFSAMVYADTQERRDVFEFFQEITWGRELSRKQ